MEALNSSWLHASHKFQDQYFLLLVLMGYPAHITLTNNREFIQRKQIMSSTETLNSFPEKLFFLGAHGRSEFQSFFAVVLAALLTLKTDWPWFLH